MEGFTMPKCGVYTGELKPRAVQALRRQGYFCVLIPTKGENKRRCVLQDIDGSKIVACFADAPETAAPEAFFADLADTLTDLPIIKIKGAPDDIALTYAENGVLTGLAPMHVNADNIAMNAMTETADGFTLELTETAGKETDFELYCPKYDFGFRTLFQAYEIKSFCIAPDGKVTER